MKRFDNLLKEYRPTIESRPTKAVIYVRTSTVDQKSGIDEQEAVCRAYCATYSMEVVGVCKEHESGRKDDRKELTRAVSMLEKGLANTLVVGRVDRLTRSLPKFAVLRDEFMRNGWLIVSADPSEEHLSDRTPSGRLFSSFIAAMAQYFVERSNERVRENFRYRRVTGLATGPLWGFELTGPEKMRRYVRATDGSFERLCKVLMKLDALPLDQWNKVPYRELCVEADLFLGNGSYDVKKGKRIWEAWIKGKYRPLVPQAHVLNWEKAHERYCNHEVTALRTGMGPEAWGASHRLPRKQK